MLSEDRRRSVTNQINAPKTVRGVPPCVEPAPAWADGMRERIASVHGILAICSEPGKGVKIEARIPLTA
ncbi:MAG: hypothetical protein ACI9W4_002506 [Rhodothermales bacterium]|jgi:hypothetical protein